jgi:transcription initiation factor TFIIA large subunit
MSPHIISSELVSSDIMAGRSGTMNVVPKVYNEVIDEVINNVNEIFADEGVDENVLGDLKALWKKKLKETKALENPPEETKKPMYIYTGNSTNSSSSSQSRPYRPVQSTGQTQRIISGGQVHSVGSKHIIPQGTRILSTSGGQRIVQGGQQVRYVSQQGQRGPQQIRTSQLQPGTRVIQVRPQSGISSNRGITRVIPQNGQQATLVPRGPTTVIRKFQKLPNQTDGGLDGLDDDDSEMSDDSESEPESEPEATNDGEPEEPLGPEDDIDDISDGEMFETDNVVVCQFDKIQRVRNKWRFSLKDGIMNLNGKDYVFQKATGESEW